MYQVWGSNCDTGVIKLMLIFFFNIFYDDSSQHCIGIVG